VFQETRRSLLVILPEREEAAYFYDDLISLGMEADVLYFPSSYRRSIQFGQPDQDNLVIRTEALSRIATGVSPVIVVTFPEGLVEKVPGRDKLQSNTLNIRKGDRISTDFIHEFLDEYGFERVDFVSGPGQFSVRGSIVDVFSYASENPFRIDFFGNEVESLRSFDMDTQVSRAFHDMITIVPDIQRKELSENRISLLEFLPENTVIYLNRSSLIAGNLDSIVQNTLENGVEEVKVSPESLLPGSELIALLDGMTVLESGGGELFNPLSGIPFHLSSQPVFNKNFTLLGDNLLDFKEQGYRILLLSAQEKQADRLRDIFRVHRSRPENLFLYRPPDFRKISPFQGKKQQNPA
jgi:transcription-repair coupling factor (superfamily II helicase)